MLTLLSVPVLLFLPWVPAAADEQSPVATQGHVRTFHISGRYNPELVPQQMLWEGYFRNIATVEEEGAELQDRRILALSKYNLKIPPQDVITVIRIAAQAVRAIDRIRDKLLAPESASGLTLADRRILLARSSEEAVRARDQRARLLPPDSFEAVRRYVTEEYIKGFEVDLPIDRE